MSQNYSFWKKRKRYETNKSHGKPYGLYLCGAEHTNSGIPAHHRSPPKCALTWISFSCQQWTPWSETYQESRHGSLCSRWRAQAQGNRPHLSSRTEQSNLSRLCSWHDESSMKHVEPTSRWVADSTKPSLCWLWVISDNHHSFSMRRNLNTWKGSRHRLPSILAGRGGWCRFQGNPVAFQPSSRFRVSCSRNALWTCCCSRARLTGNPWL